MAKVTLEYRCAHGILKTDGCRFCVAELRAALARVEAERDALSRPAIQKRDDRMPSVQDLVEALERTTRDREAAEARCRQLEDALRKEMARCPMCGNKLDEPNPDCDYPEGCGFLPKT